LVELCYTSSNLDLEVIKMARDDERSRMRGEEGRGDMPVSEAGKKGGTTTSRRYGHDFYQEIGHKGGEIGGHKGGQRVRELIEEGKEYEDKSK
jgi:hypothetical protein